MVSDVCVWLAMWAVCPALLLQPKPMNAFVLDDAFSNWCLVWSVLLRMCTQTDVNHMSSLTLCLCDMPCSLYRCGQIGSDDAVYVFRGV